MPRERGEAISKPRENLTDFGELFYEICKYLGVTPADIAILTGLSEALISKNTRVTEDAQTYPPTRKTVTRLYEAFEYAAMQKELLLVPELKEAFFNADPALLGTMDQARRASRVIGQLQSMIKQVEDNAAVKPSPKEN
jgi:transcriptional regulator with XRE-family HTH domain